MCAMCYRYCLFDFDGVIADTEGSNNYYLDKTLKKFGINMTSEDKAMLIGRNNRKHIEEMFKKAGICYNREEFLKERKKTGNSYQDGKICPYPGVEDLLKELRASGIKTALVTSTSAYLILSALNTIGITDLFNVIVCGDMVEESKPDPTIYLKAMEYLHAEPRECVVIEDSPTGIMAGKRAGAYVIGLKASKIDQDTSGSDAIVYSYEELGRLLSDSDKKDHWR